jgi:hypothetical protein
VAGRRAERDEGRASSGFFSSSPRMVRRAAAGEASRWGEAEPRERAARRAVPPTRQRRPSMAAAAGEEWGG